MDPSAERIKVFMLEASQLTPDRSMQPVGSLPAMTLQIRADGVGQIVLHLGGKRAGLDLVSALGESLPGCQITEPTVGIAKVEGVPVGRAVAQAHRDLTE